MAKKSPEPPSAEPAPGSRATDPDAGASAFAQNRLIEAQATIERDYVSLRELETRYRYLLQTSGEPIAVVAASSMRIVDVNTAACDRLQTSSEQLIGAPVARLVEARSASVLQERLDRQSSRGSFRSRSPSRCPDGSQALANPALFRQDGAPVFMLRFQAVGRDVHPSVAQAGRRCAPRAVCRRCAGRDGADRPRRRRDPGERGVRRTRPGADRATGARRVARPLARADQRRPRRAVVESQAARPPQAVRHASARRVRHAVGGRDLSRRSSAAAPTSSSASRSATSVVDCRRLPARARTSHVRSTR